MNLSLQTLSDPVCWCCLYFALISIIASAVTIADKQKAKKGTWWIPEATLFWLAAFGGSAAMYLTMHLIRHKTRHIQFMLGIPIIMGFQLVLILYLRHRLG